MGGAGFATQIESPTDPNATRGVKIRVWPGGVTHQALMQRLGYNVATVPWAELYTAMQSGVVDGQIGSTAENSLAAFGEITKTWIQLNDHFEPSWIIANKQSFAALPDDDRAIVEQAAQEATLESFDAVTQANADAMDKFREMGAEVIVLDDAQLEEFARITREEVWPEIEDELGDELMARLREAVGL